MTFWIGQRCHIGTTFERYCSEHTLVTYDLSLNGCLGACINETSCMVAHHYPGNQIWEKDQRPVCWMMDASAMPCDSTINNPGAEIIYCGM